MLSFRLSFRLSLLLWPLASANLISESSAKLPWGLSSVISDLEAEGLEEIRTAVLVTSRGVTHAQRAELLDLFQDAEVDSTAFGTEDGLCLAKPSPNAGVGEVASSAVACGGTVIYYPNEDDLARGEGLFYTLAPVMERLLSQNEGPSTLIVYGRNNNAEASIKPLLTEAVSNTGVLSNLVSNKQHPPTMLEDVFDSVHYVSSIRELEQILVNTPKREPSEAAAAVASTWAADLWSPTVSETDNMPPRDLAAARRLGPTARFSLQTALKDVEERTKDTLVMNYGELCDAEIEKAFEDLSKEGGSPLVGQIISTLKEELYHGMGFVFEHQMQLLQAACFDEFKRQLSQLRVSPNLASDMDEVVSKNIADFSKKAKKLVAKGAGSSWSTAPGKEKFRRLLKEYCSDRLLAAKASGQYRPVPRKGVTVGFHWLFPKPFGNDFRQEPWLVHATDNMVYVPPDKITDVSPEDIQSGDWRKKVIPSPAGNDMLYMQ